MHTRNKNALKFRIERKLTKMVRQFKPGFRVYNLGDLLPERIPYLSIETGIPSYHLLLMMLDLLTNKDVEGYSFDRNDLKEDEMDEGFSIIRDVVTDKIYIFALDALFHRLEVEGFIDSLDAE